MCGAHLCGNHRSRLLLSRALLMRVLLQRRARLPLHRLHRKSLSSDAGLCAGLWFREVLTGKFLSFVNKLLRIYFCSVFADLSLNSVNIITDIHAVCYCVFVAVLTYHVLIEKSESAFIRRSCQPDQKSIEIIQHLLP